MVCGPVGAIETQQPRGAGLAQRGAAAGELGLDAGQQPGGIQVLGAQQLDEPQLGEALGA